MKRRWHNELAPIIKIVATHHFHASYGWVRSVYHALESLHLLREEGQRCCVVQVEVAARTKTVDRGLTV
jgi:hypothetical protein